MFLSPISGTWPGQECVVATVEILNSLETGMEEIVRDTADTHICELLYSSIVLGHKSSLVG